MSRFLARFASLVLAAMLVTLGCAGRTATQSSALAPAPTPIDALERSFRALADGDEPAYRRVVMFKLPCETAEAQAVAMLASARLHRAVRDRGITGIRKREAGFDRGETLLANPPPTGAELDRVLQALRQMEWTVDGDTASLGPASNSQRPQVIRVDGGWLLLATDANTSAEPDHLHQFAVAAATNAAVFDEATKRVNARQLKTILQINEFITARRKEIADRAVPAVNANPSGPIVTILDDENDKPVAGATVSAIVVASRSTFRRITIATDADGRARSPAEPDSMHNVDVRATGYASMKAGVSHVAGHDNVPPEIHIRIGKPVIVGVTLELPDQRECAISVYEGRTSQPAPRGARESIVFETRTTRVKWDDAPPALPQRNLMLRLNLVNGRRRFDASYIQYRVTHARTVDGTDIPVFRDAPPPDDQTFGMYDIGRNGFEDTVFVLGTLRDARDVAEKSQHDRFKPNDHVLGAASKK